MWFDKNGHQVDAETAAELLADTEKRTVGFDEVTMHMGLRVFVWTTFVVCADCQDGRPCTPLWETLTAVYGRPDLRRVARHTSEPDAVSHHGYAVVELKWFASHQGAHMDGAA